MVAVHLESLVLSYNNFTHFPNALYFLNKLRTLSIDHNKLIHISGYIALMQSLEVLDIRYNKLTSLPQLAFGTFSGYLTHSATN